MYLEQQTTHLHSFRRNWNLSGELFVHRSLTPRRRYDEEYWSVFPMRTYYGQMVWGICWIQLDRNCSVNTKQKHWNYHGGHSLSVNSSSMVRSLFGICLYKKLIQDLKEKNYNLIFRQKYKHRINSDQSPFSYLLLRKSDLILIFKLEKSWLVEIWWP